jgi:hypothetical protein
MGNLQVNVIYQKVCNVLVYMTLLNIGSERTVPSVALGWMYRRVSKHSSRNQQLHNAWWETQKLCFTVGVFLAEYSSCPYFIGYFKTLKSNNSYLIVLIWFFYMILTSECWNRLDSVFRHILCISYIFHYSLLLKYL